MFIFIFIILIILSGIIFWLFYNNYLNFLIPIYKIPNFYLRIYNSSWIDDILNNNESKDNLIEWNGDINNVMYPNKDDSDKLVLQFRFFAEYWLNKLNINNGYTEVYDSIGNLGKYEFSKNNNLYTAKFYNSTWSWDNTDYCFNTINSKRENSCLGGWIYYEGICYPPLNSTSTCNNYDWNTIYKYTKPSQINSWMENCNISNSSTCKYP